MEIKSLRDTALEEIVDCLLLSFSGYFVEMPTEVSYWRKRFKAARVDLGISFGIFQKERLVAFIINGIDEENNQITAFNTGTGVLPIFRGQGLIDRLYEFAIPVLKSRGVKKCKLEVIQENTRAIRVYERIGFSRKRKLICFTGQLEMSTTGVSLQKTNFQEIADKGKNGQHFYSWDHSNNAILKAGNRYHTYKVCHQNSTLREIGYFVIEEETGYLPQFESEISDILFLFQGIAQVNRNIKINNVDATRTKVLEELRKLGLQESVIQFEMEMEVP